jgi:integrase
VGAVFKKTFTKPLPAGAETFVRKGERFARWKDRKGKIRTAALTTGEDGADRLLMESPYYVAKWRDGRGIVQTVSTGCRDEQAARQVLADLERRAELVKAGVMTAAEDRIADHRETPLAEHIDAYTAFQRAKDCHPNRVSGDRQRVERVAAALGWHRLAELNGEALTRWLGQQRAAGTMTPTNSNEYRRSLVGFANWCRRTERLLGNPFAHVPTVAADPERKPRALTPDELGRLLSVARLRPLAEYGRATVKRAAAEQPAAAKSRRTWTKAPLTLDTLAAAAERGRVALARRPDLADRLGLLGRERALTYKTLVLTGLRKGELESLTVAQLYLDGPDAFAVLDAADEKNRDGNAIPLRADLAEDLRTWLADRLAELQAEARRRGKPIPARLPPDSPVFNVPAGLLRILNRDAKAAGIPKRDERGRAVCLHGLRHTFGTLMSKAGVSPRTAQAAMRHSTIDLTMNVYTDPKLLDVAGALDALPALPLEREHSTMRQAVGATEINDLRRGALAPVLAPPTDFSSQSGTIPVNVAESAGRSGKGLTLAVSAESVKTKQPLTSAVSGCFGVEPRGLEPLAFALRTRRSPS